MSLKTIVFLSVLIVTATCGSLTFESISSQCTTSCSFTNETQDGVNWCDEQCRKTHCEKGCQLSENAVVSGCYSSCNAIEGHARDETAYCLVGCKTAVSLYISETKAQLGIIPTPSIVPGSVTNESVTVKWTWWWNGTHRERDDDLLLITHLTNLSLQWRFSQPDATSLWHTIPFNLWDVADSTVIVDTLHPYTSYNFRLTVSLALGAEPLTSDETSNVTTLPYGLPTSPPSDLKPVAVDGERITVTWDPPPFPNGPIVSYTLTIREAGSINANPDPSFQDFVAKGNPRSHTFIHLKQNTTYVITVAARNTVQPNAVGPAATCYVTTLPIEKDNLPVLKPSVLIVVDDKLIERHDTRLVFYDPQPMYTLKNTSITAVGVHARQGTVFVADNESSIHELVGLYPQSEPHDIYHIESEGFVIKALSVDWLFDRFYVLLESVDGSSWQIARSRFDGSGLVKLVAGVSPVPNQIEVDPYNGFLMWSVDDSVAGGLFCVDLADLNEKNATLIAGNQEKGIRHLLSGTAIASFKGDPINGRVLAMIRSKGNTTIISISFDGTTPSVVRHSMSQADNASHLIFSDEAFYWVNAGDSVFEEIDNHGNIYVNKFEAKPKSKHNALVLSDVKSQPVPVPLSAVLNLQVLLDSTTAHLKWEPPATLRQQGRGAWKEWTYKMEIENLDSGAVDFKTNIQTTELELTALQPNTSYAIKVEPEAKVTSHVNSQPFVGRTLAPNQLGPIYWAAKDGQIYASTLTGKHPKLVFNVKAWTTLKSSQELVVSMAWMNDSLFVVTNASRMFKIDIASNNVTLMRNIDAISVASDWLGRKIYWSSPRRQTIGRCDMDGNQQEWLPVVGIAKSLAVHSARGKLVWNTGHSIEASLLNGDKLETFWSPGLFSGSQAIGLTIDDERDSIYWIVKQVDGAASLYKASIDSPESSSLINVISSSTKGPLHYSTGRLLWLQEDLSTAIISGLDGVNSYTLGTPKNRAIQSFIPCNYPSEEWAKVNVIPEAVDESSFSLQKHEDGALVIVWSPIQNVSYGNVSYDIRVSLSDNEATSVTNSSMFTVPREWHIEPYAEINVTVRSFTVWSSAAARSGRLRAPSSTPEAPRLPRAFVTLNSSSSSEGAPKEATIELRWAPPAKTNGPLTLYRVVCSHIARNEQLTLVRNVTVTGNHTELILRNLMPFTTYSITIEASTEVGFGPASETLNVSTSFENPVPRLLAVTLNDLWTIDLDDHSLSTKLSSSLDFFAVSFLHTAPSYLINSKRLFWIENRNLFSFKSAEASLTRLHELNGTATGLAIDWISQQVYWSQKDNAGSSIYRLDSSPFKSYERNIAQQVIHDPNMIRIVDVDPLSSQLFWLSDNKNGTATLMKSSVSGEETELFFKGPSDECSCTEKNFPVDAVTSFDYSGDARLFWTVRTAVSYSVWSSDLDGCDCKVEFVPSEFGLSGVFSSMTVDSNHLIWSDAKYGRVYKLKRPVTSKSKVEIINEIGSRTTKSELSLEPEKHNLTNVRKVVLLSSSTQPLPKPECLKPMASNYTVSLVNATSNNLTLLMPQPKRPDYCLSTTMPPCDYVLFFGQDNDHEAGCLRNVENCHYYVSSRSVVTLEKLMPVTKYVVHVVLTNIYQPLELITPIGISSHFTTKAGTPSKPRDVSIIVTSPRAVRVQWLAPVELNGSRVSRYAVHWKLNSQFDSEPHHAIIEPLENPVGPFFTDVDKLKPHSNYSFMVQVQTVEGLSVNSDPVTVETYPDAPPLVCTNFTATTVTLSWISPKSSDIQRHALQVYYPQRGVWDGIVKQELTKEDHVYTFAVNHLKPLTTYAFRLQLLYRSSGLWFTWPQDGKRFEVTTMGTEPERPGSPRATVIVDNAIELQWAPAVSYGYPVDRYVLEMKVTETDAPFPDQEETLPLWNVVYNGSELFHVVKNLTSGPMYQFRLQAINEIGPSVFSEPTPLLRIDDAVQDAASSNADLVLGLCIASMTVFCFALMGVLLYGCGKSPFQAKKAQANGTSHPSSTSEMTDLATLRELPRRGSFIQQSNAIYDVGDCDIEQELALLPHIRFEELFITKFLGRGAFGEVFEGSTSNLPGSNQYHTKVAVKTLRKGATDQEKNEFLKEAILMSHFRHEHIIRLLGVCLDADPNFILLELMEGGDLLSYLRNSRPHLRNQSGAVSAPLGLGDLVSMCVDVAKGCCYLEELHFVHRDLAARNCLVSSLDPNYRVVKIGDFGLARDVYRNDYYRKEGEGLLPVRWMAPESLVDGVFTSQTDVWSFGVLLWEILTLGQQPYPARTNIQVLHFVRTGGRLDRPRNCPDSLFTLMMNCWSYEPTKRPTFVQCLAELTSLQTKLRHATPTAVHNESYVSNPTLPRDCLASDLWNYETQSQSEIDSRETYLMTEASNEVPAIYSNTKEELMNVINHISILNDPYSAGETDRRSNSVEDDVGTSESQASSVDNENRYVELLDDRSPSGGDSPREPSSQAAGAFAYGNWVPRRCSSYGNMQNEIDDSSNITDESCLSRSATP